MNSDLQIVTTATFNKSADKLSKKYPSLPTDFIDLRETLKANPFEGVPLGRNCYKIRMKIASKKTGKSGGARVITPVKMERHRITLLNIFDKSEKETLTDKELNDLLKQVPE